MCPSPFSSYLWKKGLRSRESCCLPGVSSSSPESAARPSAGFARAIALASAMMGAMTPAMVIGMLDSIARIATWFTRYSVWFALPPALCIVIR